MNKNTILILGGIGALGLIGFWAYSNNQSKIVTAQATPAKNSSPDYSGVIAAGSDALSNLAGLFGF